MYTECMNCKKDIPEGIYCANCDAILNPYHADAVVKEAPKEEKPKVEKVVKAKKKAPKKKK